MKHITDLHYVMRSRFYETSPQSEEQLHLMDGLLLNTLLVLQYLVVKFLFFSSDPEKLWNRILNGKWLLST